jgi:hypothetical protein
MVLHVFERPYCSWSERKPDDYALIEDGDECQQLAKSILEEYGAEQKKEIQVCGGFYSRCLDFSIH